MKKIIFPFIMGLLCSCGSDESLQAGRALMQQGKFKEALPLLNKAVEANASAATFNTRGVAYFQMKEYENALLDYEQALKIDPENYQPYFNRAKLRVVKNETDAALSDFAEAIRRSPQTTDIYLDRGQLFDLLGQLDNALTDFDKAVAIDPKNAVAWYNRGNIYFQKKDLGLAITSFQQAVQQDKKFGKAFNALGIAQLMQKKQSEGCLNLQTALRLGYKDAKVALDQYCQ